MMYEVSLKGLSPLLMHQDNITWCDSMKKWREDPANKKLSVAGDDRSPAFTWLGSLYHDGKTVAVPSGNLMSAAMQAGARVPVPGGKNGLTFKAQTQSGMVILEEFSPLAVNGAFVPVEQLLALRAESDFEAHLKAATDHGFSLFVKRAKIKQSAHVRVRPRFDTWALKFSLEVWDEQLTLAALADIWRIAGDFKGIGDWRPGSKTPGPFGRFTAEVKPVKN